MSKIKLMKGDCLEQMKKIPDGYVDAIMTDPPYGTTACKWDSIIPFDLMWEQLHRIIKPYGAIVLFGSEPFSSALRMSNIKNYKYDWIWEKQTKTGFLNAKKQPLRCNEVVSVFYKKQPTYNPQMTKGKPYKIKGHSGTETKNYNKHHIPDDINQGTRYPTSILKIDTEPNRKGNKFHSTQKPVELMEYLIKTYTNEKEIVLDFTMGSGTTGVACVNTNRNFIGIEKDEKYFDIAKKRIKEARGK